MKAGNSAWWGDFDLSPGVVKKWIIGPLTVWAQRLEGEWRLAWTSSSDATAEAVESDEVTEVEDFLSLDNASRFAKGGTDGWLRLEARLADRPMITQSEQPVSIPPGEETHVYVSTPLWVSISIGKDESDLIDVPLYRPSDTWFGANTLEGELCYSSRTTQRLSLENVPLKPHRAVTAVLVQNKADGLLKLERMRIPVPNLALCRTPDGRLWTQEVVFERTEDTAFASVHLPSRANRRCVHADQLGEIISEQRETVADNLVTRAFSSLFRLQG